jgi:hypothetical protein
MKKLIKHPLNPEVAETFFQKNLDGANALSIELLNNFKKEEGHFYTLLPKDANLEHLYQFNAGGILPQNPIKFGSVGNLGNFYHSETPSIMDDLARMIEDILHQNENVTCIIDDVIRNSSHKTIRECNDQFKSCIAFSEKSVYYLFNKENAEFPLLFDCLGRNCGYWHALTILSNISLKDCVGKQLEKPILSQICKNAQMIIIGAYDGEGYLFWEKKLGGGSL